jgi:hypothetical protein
VLPIIAVQIAPGSATSAHPVPVLEQHLLRACTAGLERARCVSVQGLGTDKPRGIAVVSWIGAEHVSIEVGLTEGSEPLWISRDLEFKSADPEAERWRAVGFTIALLADDPRFWPRADPAEPAAIRDALEHPMDQASAAPQSTGGAVVAELRGLTGSGVVSGPWRWGAELRLALPLSSLFFATVSVDYALASDTSLDVRWFDATLGVGIDAGPIVRDLDGRVRLELLGENVAATVQRGGATERASTWVPGVSLGGDLHWSMLDDWLLSARADAFWLDGSTVIVSAGERVGSAAGAGVLLGLGAGYRF